MLLSFDLLFVVDMSSAVAAAPDIVVVTAAETEAVVMNLSVLG